MARMKLESNPLLNHDSITQKDNHHTTTAIPFLPTHLLIQPLIFFMVNSHMVNDWKYRGGAGEHDNLAIQTQLKDIGQRVKPEQLEHTEPSEPSGQHPQHELMNAAPTPDNLNMPDASYNHECNRGVKQRRAATRSTSNQENKKKIIFKITINTCNNSFFQCNMLVESRSRTQARKNEIKYRLKVEDKGRCKENVSSTNSI
jgi:hypothetical protein